MIYCKIVPEVLLAAKEYFEMVTSSKRMRKAGPTVTSARRYVVSPQPGVFRMNHPVVYMLNRGNK